MSAIDTDCIHRIESDHPAWPPLLNTIPDPPETLWVRGNLEALGRPGEALGRPGVAIVGSRSCTVYGHQVAQNLAAGLVSTGYAIVSGMAFGIDAAAHHGALGAHGATIAVLACGVDRPYPTAHRALMDAILKGGGAIVSEYEPGTAPARERFLARNRLITGMSTRVVVVEAAERSGAMNAAMHAHRQGRDLCAVPGPITSTVSAGPHQLIQEGYARLVTRVEDILTPSCEL